MNRMFVTQNTSEMIKLLQASAVAYRRAKRGESIIAVVVIALALAYPPAFMYLGNASFNLVLFATSFCLTVAVLIITPLLKANTSTGALCKEEFDCTVFGLPWKSTLVHPDLSTILSLSALYRGKPPQDWYASHFSATVPRLLVIAALQKSNTDWDIALRSSYRRALIVLVILYTAALWGLFIYNNSSAELIFSVHFSVLSFYSYFIDAISGHSSVIKRRAALAAHLDSVFRTRAVVSVEMLRDIQDEIFASRLESAKVPDFFFRLRHHQLALLCDAYIDEINRLYGT